MAVLNTEVIARFAAEALEAEVRKKLTEHFESIAKPLIGEMVEQCVKSFNVDAQVFHDSFHMRDVISFMLTDRTEKQAAE